MKSSSLVYPEDPMNGLEAEPFILIIFLASLGLKDDIKKMLEKKDYDLDERDDWGQTAALVAAQRNDLDMLKFLVDNGAHLDIADHKDRTVLGWAEKNKNPKMIQYVKEELEKAHGLNNTNRATS